MYPRRWRLSVVLGLNDLGWIASKPCDLRSLATRPTPQRTYHVSAIRQQSDALHNVGLCVPENVVRMIGSQLTVLGLHVPTARCVARRKSHCGSRPKHRTPAKRQHAIVQYDLIHGCVHVGHPSRPKMANAFFKMSRSRSTRDAAPLPVLSLGWSSVDAVLPDLPIKVAFPAVKKIHVGQPQAFRHRRGRVTVQYSI